MFISKRVLWIIGAVVVVVMLAAGVGLAYAFSSLGQASAANANLSATATASALATSTPAAQKPAQRRVVGVIQSLGNQSFVLSVEQGKHIITVSVSASTKYTHAGQSAAFSDLQVGETVAIMGTYDTKAKTAQATRVVISPPVKSATPTASPTATPTL